MAKKILIADDEMNIRELVKASLKREQFELYEAEDGNEALQKARQIKPDLIVLDVMMPGKVGYEVCEELKSDPETKGIYIIFLTARGGSVAETTGKMQGGDAFMVKPFEPKELREKVRKALGME